MVTSTGMRSMTDTSTGRGFVESAYEADPLVRHPMAWRAVFGATALAMTVQLVLALLGLAIGATAADPTTTADPITALGAGFLIWGCVSGLIAFGIGGYVAGNMSNAGHVCGGAAHGLMVWAIAGVFGMTLAALSGAAVLGGAASGAPRISLMGEMDRGGDASRIPAMEGTARGAVSTERNAGLPPSGGRPAADTAMTDSELREAARRAAKYTSRASLFAAIALCMGAVGGAGGGAMGRKAREKSPNPDPRAA